MIDLRAVTADALRAALGSFTFDKMGRAWRNRSPVSQSRWCDRARAILPAAGPSECQQLAAALYCACGEHVWTDDSFRPDTLATAAWERIAQNTVAYALNLPEKALSRGQYDSRRSSTP